MKRINLKQYLGRSLPAKALTELHARGASIIVYRGDMSRGIIRPHTLAKRIGKARMVQGVSCTFKVQDASVPEWDAYTGTWLGYQSYKDWFRTIVPNSKAHGPGDYCSYCGAYNGPNGEQRIGWDCCYCGGN
jgi:hypothetical protein